MVTLSAMYRVLVAALLLAACHDHTESSSPPPPPPKPIDAGVTADASDYVPAEFKSGAAKWKDTFVYLDGRPIGVLQFGELPITLKPTWMKSKVSQNKPPGCPSCPAWKWGEERAYKFTDYLKALGIPLAKIKQIHVQGPKTTNTIVATGRDLLSPAANDFLFRFGGSISGKAIPHVPENFGNGEGPDKITAVMIYIDKTPPTFDDTGYVLDGHPIDGVPYYGDPARGGVRVYMDDRLAMVIKRSELDPKQAHPAKDGELEWPLYEVLQKNGVDTKKIVEGWVVRREERKEHFPAAELATMSFQASSQSGKGEQGSVLLGDQKVVANVIALHSRVIDPKELPEIRPDERD